MRPFIFVLVLVACCLAVQGSGFAKPALVLKGKTLEVTTASYFARLKGASLYFFANRLTGEVMLQTDKPPAAGVYLAKSKQPKAVFTTPATPLEVKITGPATAVASYRLDFEGCRLDLEYTIEATPAELLITGKGRASKPCPGLASLVQGFASPAKGTEILVPQTGGTAFKADEPFARQVFEWPITWEASLVEIQGAKGGLLVYARDKFERFKTLELQPTGEGWEVHCATENPAPFAGKHTIQGLTWRFRPYSGDWRTGARFYRDWLYATFKPTLSEDPAWVKDIRAEFHLSLDQPELLEALQAVGVDPRQTLLYLPSWRTNGYDRNYPDYTPNPRTRDFIEKAHRLGYRVMLHVNYFGVDPKRPEYERFAPYQFRSKYTGERLWWEWPATPPIKFAYIDPACKEWREFFVKKMQQVVKATGADALHLDQTLAIFNDGLGLMDGLNSAQGNLLLHEELKRALPGVALSGEGLDEVTFLHEAFAQRHVFGLNPHTGKVDRRLVELACPISAYLFDGRTKPYQYLGTCNPDRAQLFLAWQDAYRHWGVLPGLAWPRTAQLKQPKGATLYALQVVRAFQRSHLDYDLEGEWPGQVDFPFVNAEGERFAFLSTPSGWMLGRVAPSGELESPLAQVLTGVRTVELPGSIQGWLCYDEQALQGLDPAKYYVYLPTPRKLKPFYATPLSHSAEVEFAGNDERLLWVKTSPPPARDLLVEFPSAERYCITRTGEYRKLGFETDVSGATVQPRPEALFIHPPYKAEWNPPADSGTIGVTGISWHLVLPEGKPMRFSAEGALAAGAGGKSDGVEVEIRAEAHQGKLSRVFHVAGEQAVPLELDLAPLAGQKVKLTVQVSPGPKHDPSFDWFLLVRPRLQPVTAPLQSWRFHLPKGVRYLLAPHFEPLEPTTAEMLDLQVAAGASFLATGIEPVAADLPLDLLQLPYWDQVKYDYALSHLSDAGPAGKVEYSVGHVKKPALFLHPPDQGCRYAHWFLQLKRGRKARFTAYVGLRDGAEQSKGALVRLLVNGETAWQASLEPGSPWKRVSLSLAKWCDKPFLLTLVSDSEGSWSFDWVLWGEPKLVPEE